MLKYFNGLLGVKNRLLSNNDIENIIYVCILLICKIIL